MARLTPVGAEPPSSSGAPLAWVPVDWAFIDLTFPLYATRITPMIRSKGQPTNSCFQGSWVLYGAQQLPEMEGGPYSLCCRAQKTKIKLYPCFLTGSQDKTWKRHWEVTDQSSKAESMLCSHRLLKIVYSLKTQSFRCVNFPFSSSSLSFFF